MRDMTLYSASGSCWESQVVAVRGVQGKGTELEDYSDALIGINLASSLGLRAAGLGLGREGWELGLQAEQERGTVPCLGGRRHSSQSQLSDQLAGLLQPATVPLSASSSPDVK